MYSRYLNTRLGWGGEVEVGTICHFYIKTTTGQSYSVAWKHFLLRLISPMQL